MTNMIRPTRPGAVTIPPANNTNTPMGVNMGGYGSPQQPMMQQDPLQAIQSMYGMGSQGTGGGTSGLIDWGYESSPYAVDPAFKEMCGSVDEQQDLMQFYVRQTQGYIAEFIQSMNYRRGGIYNEFLQTLQGFVISDVSFQPCPVRKAFCDTISKNAARYTNHIGRQAAIFFGYGLTEIFMNEKLQEGEKQRQYRQKVEIAFRNVLTYEMFNWLSTSKEGKQLSLNLPKDLADKLANLDSFKDLANNVFQRFGLPSPYDGLTFKIEYPERGDYALFMRANHQQEPVFSGNNYQQTSGGNEFDRMNAMAVEKYRRSLNQENYADLSPKEERIEPRGTDRLLFNNHRNDIENITPGNRDQFNIFSYFKNIGKENHYFVHESDWKHIKRAFKKHPEMKLEESVADSSCFRIVVCDLINNSGWFSTIARKEGLDVMRVLADPKILLPLLEHDDHSGFTVVANNVEDVIKDEDSLKSFIIPAEEVVEVNKRPSVIVIKDPIISNKSEELEGTVIAINNRLSKDINITNAIIIPTVIKDTFLCEDKETKHKLFKDFPFLFKENRKLVDDMSYRDMFDELESNFVTMRYEKDIIDFVYKRMTQTINDWLVNECGYELNNPENMLSIDDCRQDFNDLLDVLKNKNHTVFMKFMTNEHFTLKEQLMMFTLEESETERNAVENLKYEIEVPLKREICTVMMNNISDPEHVDNETVIMKRSKFPEYFALVEEGMKKLKKSTQKPFDGDVVLHFKKNDARWLFNYAIADNNVAILRRVTRRKEMILMGYD